MAETRLHLINLHTSGTTAPTESADLRLGEIAVQHNDNNPALYIKKTNGGYAKFVPNIDISGATTGSGNVVTGVSVANNTVTAALGNVVDSASGDTLISATVSGGTKVVVSATTALSQAVAEAHTHDNMVFLMALQVERCPIGMRLIRIHTLTPIRLSSIHIHRQRPTLLML